MTVRRVPISLRNAASLTTDCPGARKMPIRDSFSPSGFPALYSVSGHLFGGSRENTSAVPTMS
jgi:hypothetical protein